MPRKTAKDRARAWLKKHGIAATSKRVDLLVQYGRCLVRSYAEKERRKHYDAVAKEWGPA